MSVHLLTIGVIRSESGVLLVRQGSDAGPGTAWALPGGRVDDGELAIEALAREIREETGLTVTGEPRLISVGQMVNPTHIQRDAGELPPAGGSAVVFAYEVTSFEGSVDWSGDPDGDVAEVSWHPVDAAAALLARHPFPFVRAVARNALLGEANHCYFRRDGSGEDVAVTFPR